jgi:glycine hydroxymethyltransferase
MRQGVPGALMSSLRDVDPEIARILQRENERQKAQIDLIAAENYCSPAVLEAQGSVLTNKYAEGYPGRRYYAGCEHVDEAEDLANERAKELFAAGHANVQPHSGAQANMAAYFALLEPGDTVLSMSLAHGGHLTHGGGFNFSGKLYRFVTYGVSRESQLIDYDVVEKLARQHKPKLIVAGASSYPRVVDFEQFRRIAASVSARLMVDMAHLAGLVAAGVHPSPVPYADVVTSTTHKTLRGPRGGFILCGSEIAGDIDASVFPGTQGGPLMHVIAAKAVAFHEAAQPGFAAYQRTVVDNAALLAGELQRLGLQIVTGGTENHIVLVDLTQTGITGRDAEVALQTVGIPTNRNAIPFDPRPPRVASGIRLGTSAVTTRGFGHGEIRTVARMIADVLAHIGDSSVYDRTRREVQELTARFPAPGVAG